MDALTVIDSSVAVLDNEKKEEDNIDDDWVLVKKQKIIILVPPPSPQPRKTETDKWSKQTKQQRAGKSSVTKKIKQNRLSRIRNNKSSSVPGCSDHLIEVPLCKSQFNVRNIGSVNVVNRRIKAMYLENKLQALGGFRRWLASLGLEWLANVLERKNLNQYQLVNLTMSKLKDMGIKAVGPRRKIIHAIDALCQPYNLPGNQ